MAPTLIEQKARTLARLLSGHGLTVPHDQLVGLIEERRDTLAAAMHIQPTSALRYLDDDALADLAATMVQTVRQAGHFTWSLGQASDTPMTRTRAGLHQRTRHGTTEGARGAVPPPPRT